MSPRELKLEITLERPDSLDAAMLIEELDSSLNGVYETESRHGYSVQKLIDEGVHFCVARVDGEPAGCGGVQFFGDEYAELKRMYVRPAHRGRKVGKSILAFLAEYASRQGITLLRLETGIHQTEAIHMYERYGFKRIPPFGPYWDDPVSLCYEAHLPLVQSDQSTNPTNPSSDNENARR